MLLPVVCEKCEFKVETTILLKDSQSKEPLDLTKTLNEHGLREVFAKDTAAGEPVDHEHQPKTHEAGMIEDSLTWKLLFQYTIYFKNRLNLYSSNGTISIDQT